MAVSKKNKRIGAALIVAGIILVIAALALVSYNFWDSGRAGEASKQALELLNEQIGEPEEDEIPLYKRNPDMEMPSVEIDGVWYIGRLDIPSLDLSLPVIADWSYPSLDIAPCRYSGTIYKKNMVIAAHNFDSHFGRLNKLRQGEGVTYTDVLGNVFEYSVGSMEQLGPFQIEDMKSGDWDLTLFTCTIGGEYRVTVRCYMLD